MSKSIGGIYFSSPEQAEIALFDECNLNILANAINSDRSITVFNQRPMDLWLGIRVLHNLYFLKELIKWKEITEHPRGIVRGILREFKRIYILACLKAIKPKAVVTIIDNSSTFGWLAKNCRDFPFIAIQNGSRLSYAIAMEPPVYHQHLFCFGTYEINHLSSHGWEVENFYPVGSLLASLYFFKEVDNEESSYDLLIVSSWRGNIGYTTDVQDTIKSMRIMDQLLCNYLKSKGLKAAVILRSERDSEHWFIPELDQNEFEYFKSIYGANIEIIETSNKDRNIFELIMKSEVIVGFLSTALVEALGIGKKILFFNYTGKNEYHMDCPQILVCSEENQDLFNKKLDSLFSIDSRVYSKDIQDLKSIYMNFSNTRPTFEIIIEKIDLIIKEKGEACLK